MNDPIIDVEFFDNFLPPLPARDYSLEVTQSVELLEQYAPPPEPYESSKRIRVAGPHFGLAPGDVSSVYPPPNSQATYRDVLPAVSFSNRSLPWQITIGGATTGPLVAPWLAVLLLTPEEIIVPTGAGPAAGNLTGTQVVPLTEYLNPPIGIFGPQFTAQEKAAFEKQYEKLTVTVVDVAGDAFFAIAPGLHELPYLAHVRESETEDQEISTTGEDGWVATVLGTRFPVGSRTGLYVAHLVSLEGFGGVLPESGAQPGEREPVRLISLHSWAFNSLDGGGDFAAIMAHLDSNTLQMPDLIPHPVDEPERELKKALQLGYTALRYGTRLGEETVGWYRGPCLPVPMLRNMQPVYGAAEAGLIYGWDYEHRDSDGFFDLSFGAAWQIGRLTALADRQFTIAFLAWIRQNNSIAQLLAERIDLFQQYSSLELPERLEELLAPDLMRRHTRRFLTQTLAPMMAPPDPRATRDAPPLLARPRPLLGPPRDPSRILAQLDRYPGVVSPGSFLGHLYHRTGRLFDRRSSR